MFSIDFDDILCDVIPHVIYISCAATFLARMSGSRVLINFCLRFRSRITISLLPLVFLRMELIINISKYSLEQ